MALGIYVFGFLERNAFLSINGRDLASLKAQKVPGRRSLVIPQTDLLTGKIVLRFQYTIPKRISAYNICLAGPKILGGIS